MNGLLHKALYKNRAQDLLVAWSYTERKRVAFVYSEVRKRHQKAWRTTEVAELVGRRPRIVERYVREKVIREPQFTYALDGVFKNKFQYLWRDEDIIELHEYLLTQHRGRPRADGGITPQSSTPSRAELRARLKNETVFYVKNSDGEYVKVWKEPEW